MGISDRKEREKAEKKRMILDAAMQLFIEEGYESVSIRKIAERIEYSPATIYTYFADKGNILLELHNEGFNALYEMQLSVQYILDPKERLIQHGLEYIRFALKNPQYYTLMFVMPIQSKYELCLEYNDFQYGERSYDILQKNIDEVQAVGYLQNTNREFASFFFWSTVHGVATLLPRKFEMQLLELTSGESTNKKIGIAEAKESLESSKEINYEAILEGLRQVLMNIVR